MTLYQTKQRFGHKRATVGAIVVLAALGHTEGSPPCLHAGVIGGISGSRDAPYVRDLRQVHDVTGAAMRPDFRDDQWTFVETKTAEEMQHLPAGAWTWPIEAPSTDQLRDLAHEGVRALLLASEKLAKEALRLEGALQTATMVEASATAFASAMAGLDQLNH